MRIAVGRLHDLVGQMFHRFLDFDGIEFSADEPLDRENSAFGIRDRLPLGDLSHQPLTAFGDSHYGRGGPAPLGVRDHDRLAALHDRNARIGSSQIDSYYFCHDNLLKMLGDGRRFFAPRCISTLIPCIFSLL